MIINNLFIPILGYEGLYSISREGHIYSHKTKRYRSVHVDQWGYIAVRLCKKGVTYNHKLHRLLAQTYIQNPYNKVQVVHKNSNKGDNRIENLMWINPSDNLRKAWENKVCSRIRDNKGRFISKKQWERAIG